MARSYRYRSHRSDAGYERALQHIAEAKALSEELGGNDKDVKEFFFNLDTEELGRVLDAYENAYGTTPREYAEEALPQWRSGKRKMSGLVASRLFSILPAFMSIQDKFKLVESLWKHLGPKSTRYVYIGRKATPYEVRSLLLKEIEKLSTSWAIPDEMKKRFHWLSGGDVDVEQRLLAHITELEKDQSGKSATDLITEFMQRYEVERSRSLASFRHIITVGNQKLQVEFSNNDESERLDHPKPTVHASNNDSESIWPRIIWFLIAGFILLAIINH